MYIMNTHYLSHFLCFTNHSILCVWFFFFSFLTLVTIFYKISKINTRQVMINGIQKTWQRYVYHATSYDGLSTSSHLLNLEAINQQSTHGADHFISHFPFYSVLVIIIHSHLRISYHLPMSLWMPYFPCRVHNHPIYLIICAFEN